MADRSSERDRRVRQLMGNRNPGFDVIGQAQAEIQDAQSELYNHIALQNAQEQSRLRETAMISQAAQGMLAMERGDQLSIQAASMNPSTQATLGKYGVRPNQSQNSSRNIQTQRIISKTGDTTNIRNENITNNRTDIKITQPSVPMQQSTPVVVNGGKKEDSTAKFKAWLNEMFARQQNEAEVQRKEYRKKEWNLGRTTNKLMKKIGDATSNLGNKLDPKNMTTTLGGQLKWLLLIFGATMIGKVFRPAMEHLANIEGGIRAALGLEVNDDLKKNSTKALSIVDQLREAIGIDTSKDNTSLIEGIGNVFMEGIDKLIAKLQLWFEDRSIAMRSVEFPSMGKIDFGALGGILGPAMDGVVTSLRGVGQYLGDIITVALGGSKGRARVEANKIERQAKTQFINTAGKQVYAGDSGLIAGNGRDYMRNSDYNIFGGLNGSASSTHAMSRSLISMFNDRSGKGHSYEIATGVSQLFDVGENQGHVTIDPELLGYLGVGQQDLVNLQRQGMLTQVPYRLIAVRPNDAQKTEMGAYNGNTNAIGAGITGSALGIAASVGLGFIHPLLGIAASSVLVPGGGLVGAGIGANVDKWYKDVTSKGYYTKLVPANSPEVGADGTMGIEKPMWVLNRQGISQIKGMITKGMSDSSINMTNPEFMKFIKKQGAIAARKNGVILGTETLSGNNYRASLAQVRNYEQKVKDLDTDDRFRHVNAFSNSVGNLINRGVDYVASGLTNVGHQIKGKRLGRAEQNHRAAYLMKLAMDVYGFTREQAAGIAGNIWQECQMNEKAFNEKETSGGIAQWNKRNLTQVLEYARKYYGCNVDPNNPHDIEKVPFHIQADILMKQLNGELYYWNGKRAGEAIRNSSTIQQAVYCMERLFEVSGDYAKDNKLTRRNEYANGSYELDLSGIDLNNPPKPESTFLDSVGDALIFTGGIISSTRESSSSSPTTKTLTPEQQSSTKALNTYNDLSGKVKSGALLRGGAKSDGNGVYVDVGGGLRAYLNEGANPLNGSLTGDDVSFVVKDDGKGNLNPVTTDEETIAKQSVKLKMSSMFSSYKGKGSVDDRMKKPNGDLIMFDLGEFTDIEGFSDYAQKKLRGKIHFWICLTKDATDVALIEIKPKFLSRIALVLLKDYDKLTEQDEKDLNFVGPTIYAKGRQWFNVWEDGNKTYDWQPTARFENVWLTPKANEKLVEFISFINSGRLNMKNGKLYIGDRLVTKEELDKYKDMGLISQVAGNQFSLSGNLGASKGINEALDTASSLIGAGESFKTKEYFEELGTSFGEHKKFFEKYKNEPGYFFYRNGNIIGPGGVVWGTYKDNNGKRSYSIIDNINTFRDTQRKLGNDGLTKNDYDNKMELQMINSSSLGELNYNVVGDFVKSIQNVNLSEESDDFKSRVNSKVGTRSAIIDQGQIMGRTFEYYVFTDASGNIIKYKMTKKQLKDFMGRILGHPLEKVSRELEDTSVKGLFAKLVRLTSIERFNDGQHRVDVYSGMNTTDDEKIAYDENYILTHNDSSYNDSGIGKLYSYLKGKGKIIDKIERGRDISGAPKFIVHYKDGTKEGFGVSNGYSFSHSQKISPQFWTRINKEIEEVQKAAAIEKGIDNWEGSAYKSNLDQMIDLAKKGDINFKFNYNPDGTITSENGVVFDTWDPSKSREEGKYAGKGGINSSILRGNSELAEMILRSQAADVINNDTETKKKFLEKYYNARRIGNELWSYSADEKYRAKINLDTSIDQINKENFFEGSVEKIEKNGKWTKVSDSKKQEGMDKIYSGIDSVVKNIDLVASLAKILTTQGEEDAQQTIAKILQEQEAIAIAKNQEDYLKILAYQAAGYSTEQLKVILEETELRTNSIKANAIGVAAETIGFKNNMFVGENLYTGADGKKYIVGKNGTLMEAYIGEDGILHAKKLSSAGAARVEGDTIVYDGKQISIDQSKTVVIASNPSGNTTVEGSKG